jgi:hypothetical protein
VIFMRASFRIRAGVRATGLTPYWGLPLLQAQTNFQTKAGERFGGAARARPDIDGLADKAGMERDPRVLKSVLACLLGLTVGDTAMDGFDGMTGADAGVKCVVAVLAAASDSLALRLRIYRSRSGSGCAALISHQLLRRKIDQNRPVSRGATTRGQMFLTIVFALLPCRQHHVEWRLNWS